MIFYEKVHLVKIARADSLADICNTRQLWRFLQPVEDIPKFCFFVVLQMLHGKIITRL